jgi:hypothetical protein
MTAPPSRWREGALNLAENILAIALMLYVAGRLIMAVLPILIGVGAVALLGCAAWVGYQFWRSRW